MRLSTRIVFFLIFLNGAAHLLVASGVAADWGIEPSVGGDEELDRVNQTAKKLEPSGGGLSTLFGVFTAVAETGNSIFETITAGPDMIMAAGVPGWLVSFLFRGMYLIIGIDVIYMLSQRRM